MGSSPNKISLTVVVNGTPVEIEANLNAPVHTIVQHALDRSGNGARPASDWELKDEGGSLIAVDQKVGGAGISNHSVLFLTLAVGVQG